MPRIASASEHRASITPSIHSRPQSSQKKSPNRRDPYIDKEPYQIDYLKRAKPEYEVSELIDDDILFAETITGKPVEAIFAELYAGSYFGELAL